METITDLAAGATDKLKGMTDQMAMPSVGMNMPKSVTDQISSLKGSSVVTGESHFLEVTISESVMIIIIKDKTPILWNSISK
jgi:hypothetical protein